MNNETHDSPKKPVHDDPRGYRFVASDRKYAMTPEEAGRFWLEPLAIETQDGRIKNVSFDDTELPDENLIPVNAAMLAPFRRRLAMLEAWRNEGDHADTHTHWGTLVAAGIALGFALSALLRSC